MRFRSSGVRTVDGSSPKSERERRKEWDDSSPPESQGPSPRSEETSPRDTTKKKKDKGDKENTSQGKEKPAGRRLMRLNTSLTKGQFLPPKLRRYGSSPDGEGWQRRRNAAAAEDSRAETARGTLDDARGTEASVGFHVPKGSLITDNQGRRSIVLSGGDNSLKIKIQGDQFPPIFIPGDDNDNNEDKQNGERAATKENSSHETELKKAKERLRAKQQEKAEKEREMALLREKARLIRDVDKDKENVLDVGKKDKPRDPEPDRRSKAVGVPTNRKAESDDEKPAAEPPGWWF